MSESMFHMPDDVPSEPAVRTCREMPGLIAGSVLDSLSIGLLVVHSATRTIYANAAGIRILNSIEQVDDRPSAESAVDVYAALFAAISENKPSELISIQFPEQPLPSLFRFQPMALPSTTDGEWKLARVELDGCEDALSCPTCRLWLPLLLGKP